MSLALLFLVEAFAVMRVTRFVWMDDLWKGWRTALKGWLQMGHVPDDVIGTPEMEDWLNDFHNKHPQHDFWRRKGYDLIDCGWCISIWVAAGVMAATRLFTSIGEDVPVPVWWWLGLSAAAVLQLEWTDGSRTINLVQEKK